MKVVSVPPLMVDVHFNYAMVFVYSGFGCVCVFHKIKNPIKIVQLRCDYSNRVKIV